MLQDLGGVQSCKVGFSLVEPAREVIAHGVVSQLVGNLALEGLLTGPEGRGSCKQTHGMSAGAWGRGTLCDHLAPLRTRCSHFNMIQAIGSEHHVSPALCIYMHGFQPVLVPPLSVFLMWTVFKVFIEFVTILFYIFAFQLGGMQDVSSLNRDLTSVLSHIP